MSLDKFLDFSLNIVLREFLENEQVMLLKNLIKVNMLQALLFQ